MRIHNRFILFWCLVFSFSGVYAQVFEETGNFSGIEIKDAGVRWGYLTVAENWLNESNANRVKLAVAIVKSRNGHPGKGMVFLEGGPGLSAIWGIRKWLNHPLRQERDIILVDLRGAGYSTPLLCADLGNTFMKILAEDYDMEKEIAERVKAAIACRDTLIKKNIDIASYNSESMSYDLHALKNALGYDAWMVYGVSYGTRIALEYSRQFGNDIEKMILDSPVLPMAGLYDNNTSNYVRSLNILFEKCRQDEKCSAQYGDLEKLFYSTIADLKKEPMTVEVPKNIHPSGRFTVNAQDFMMAVHQGLYNVRFFAVLPLMIREFNSRNDDAVSALVTALKGRLSLAYGTFYCVLCNETLPVNSVNGFEQDAGRYKGLVSGLSFYRGDYSVCEKWFDGYRKTDGDSLRQQFRSSVEIPTLILSGEFDPVTPPENGKALQGIIARSTFVTIPNQGHVPGFQEMGKQVVTAFMASDKEYRVNSSVVSADRQNFVTDIFINGGVNKLGNDIRQTNLYALVPVALAWLVSLIVLIYLPFVIWRNRTIFKAPQKIIYTGTWINSLSAILFFLMIVLGLSKTGQSNSYVLAFGLPDAYAGLFILPYIILLLGAGMAFLFFRLAGLKARKVLVLAFLSWFILLIGAGYWSLYW
jgi:pimeloyl-ACP methyl ester carboxylesterase